MFPAPARTMVPLLLLAATALAVEIVYVDGRREVTEQVLSKDGDLAVRTPRGMRRIKKFDVAQLVADDGQATTFERALSDAPLTDAQEADLAALPKLDGIARLETQQRLAESLNRAVLARLVDLAADEDDDTRANAAVALARMGVKESVEPAVAIALGDDKKDVRASVASALLGIAGLVQVHGWGDLFVPGLTHKERDTRAIFALVLGTARDERAIPVLQKDGLRHPDHHFREAAAETLAALGDDSGLDLLIKMLKRTTHPSGDEELMIQEKIRICGYCEKLGEKKAASALKRAARSDDARLATAAQRALTAIDDR